MQVMALVYVMVGGAIGSMLRYIIMNFIGRSGDVTFPYSTLCVNILGSFLMGAWIAIMAHWLPERGRDMNLLFAVGVLGGFTTFSTFSLDVFYLFERGAIMQAATYILSSVICSTLALMIGMFLVSKAIN
jgi:CrcB protein